MDGYTTVGGDCADLDPNLNVLDIDGDGYTSCSNDCNDENFLIHPYATERSFDNIDQDCDGYDLGISIFAGGHHTCVINPDAEIKCWGAEEELLQYGQAIQIPHGNFSLLSLGGFHTCAEGANGFECWGAGNTIGNSPQFGQLLMPAITDFVQVETGKYHTCGLRSNQEVVCWGATLTYLWRDLLLISLWVTIIHVVCDQMEVLLVGVQVRMKWMSGN